MVNEPRLFARVVFLFVRRRPVLAWQGIMVAAGLTLKIAVGVHRKTQIKINGLCPVRVYYQKAIDFVLSVFYMEIFHFLYHTSFFSLSNSYFFQNAQQRKIHTLLSITRQHFRTERNTSKDGTDPSPCFFSSKVLCV